MYGISEILLSWGTISSSGARGEVLGYRVQYWLSEMQEIPVFQAQRHNTFILAPNRTTILTGLQQFAQYRIRIQAFTEGGFGVWSPEQNGGDVPFLDFSYNYIILKSIPLAHKNSVQYGLKSIRYMGAKMWNDLPVELRNSPSKHSFKKHLKHTF